jgi:hypothetical protein
MGGDNKVAKKPVIDPRVITITNVSIIDLILCNMLNYEVLEIASFSMPIANEASLWIIV